MSPGGSASGLCHSPRSHCSSPFWSGTETLPGVPSGPEPPLPCGHPLPSHQPARDRPPTIHTDTAALQVSFYSGKGQGRASPADTPPSQWPQAPGSGQEAVVPPLGTGLPGAGAEFTGGPPGPPCPVPSVRRGGAASQEGCSAEPGGGGPVTAPSCRHLRGAWGLRSEVTAPTTCQASPMCPLPWPVVPCPPSGLWARTGPTQSSSGSRGHCGWGAGRPRHSQDPSCSSRKETCSLRESMRSSCWKEWARKLPGSRSPWSSAREARLCRGPSTSCSFCGAGGGRGQGGVGRVGSPQALRTAEPTKASAGPGARRSSSCRAPGGHQGVR